MLRFSGTADFGEVSKELATLQAGFANLQKQMAAAQKASAHPDNVKVYQDQLKAVQRLRDGYSELVDGQKVVVPGLNQMMAATGQFTVSTIKSTSATTQFNKALADQKLGLSQLIRNYSGFREQVRAATQEQVALSKASAAQFTTNSVGGKNTISLFVPKDVGPELDNLRTKYGYLNYAIGQLGKSTLNWGKNTQWAGRQLTAGISMPLLLATAGITTLAYQADQQLTRIAKVYNTESSNIQDVNKRQAATEAELANLRKASLTEATNLAKQYGASLQETLSTEADLAAIGKQGNDLLQTTAQVTRVATLGELDHQTALNMTISLMSAFKLNASQLGDAFNYMNALENQTSLSTKDFAEAIPKAASALAGLGVSVQQFGVLMTAFKEGGVNAIQGANALKSATARLLSPTNDAVDAFAKMNINIEAIVKQTKGNLFDTLEILAQKMQGFDQLTRMTAIKDLFGTYQFNRLNVVLNGLGDALAGVSTNMSQTAEAIKVMKAGTTSWAQTANQEMQQLHDSASFKLKAAFESLKAELVSMGQPIMNALTPVVNFVTSVVHAFNNSPSAFKKFVAGALVIMGIVGPITMLIGLFANMTGNITKTISAIGNLFLKFKPLTEEQAANEALARIATGSYSAEAQAVAILAQKVNTLTTALLDNQKALKDTTATSAAAALAPEASTGRFRDPKTGRFIAAAVATQAVEGAAVTDAEVENMNKFTEDVFKMGESTHESLEATEGLKVNFRQIAGTGAALAFTGLGIKQLVDGTASWMDEILNVSLVLASLEAGGVLRGLKKIFKDLADDSINLAEYANTFKGVWAKALLVMQTGFKAVKVAASFLFTNPFGIALLALAAVGTALAIIISKQHEAAEAQAEINKSAQDWADILGYTERQQDALNKKEADSLSVHQARAKLVDQLRDKNEALVSALQDAAAAGDNFNKVYDLALNEALKVRADGGSAAQAKQAFQVALQAAGLTDQTIDKLTLKFDRVDLSNADQVANDIINQIQQSFNNMDNSDLMRDFWQSLFTSDTITDDTKAKIEKVTGLFFSALNSGASNDTKAQAFQAFQANIANFFTPQWNQIRRKNKALFKQMGIDSISDLYAAVQEAQRAKNPSASQSALLDAVLGKSSTVMAGKGGAFTTRSGGAFAQDLKAYGNAWKTVLDTIGKSLGYTGKDLDNWESKIDTLPQLMAAIKEPTMTAAEAQKAYGKALKDAKDKNGNLTEAEKLKLLNVYRAKAGLDAATKSTQGFKESTRDSADASKQAADAYLNMADALKVNVDAFNGQQYADFIKSSFSGAANAVFSQASTLAQRHEQAIEDGIQSAGQIRQDALKAQEKQTNDYYDAQEKALDKAQTAEERALSAHFKKLSDGYGAAIKQAQDSADAKTKAIQKEIDAMQKQDDERRQLFDNEKTRIERLAQLYTNNVNYNAALNSGNLDEAARIYSSNAATVQEYGIEDQQKAMDAANKAREDALQQKIDQINAERDAYVAAVQAKKDALSDQQDAEEQALQDRQQAEKDELAKRKQNALDALQAAEEAQSKQTQNALQNQQLRFQQNQETLALELDTLKASVPRTKAEYDALITKIENAYAAYGVDLKGYGSEWSSYIGSALQSNIATAAASLQSDIGWGQIGQYIQQQIDSGAGVTMAQVVNFLRTGVWSAAPAQGQVKPWKPAQARPASQQEGGFHAFARHSGGYSGEGYMSHSSRVGVPVNAPMFPSEYLTLLRRGEFVVNKTAAEKNQGLLEAINSGNLPDTGFLVRHIGGPVGLTSGNDVMMNTGLAHAATEKRAASLAVANARLAAQKTALDAMLGYTGGMTNSIAATLNFARGQQGKPYIWGGAGPAGQDCSGFMSVLYNYLVGHSPAGNAFPWGRDWVTASFAGGREFGPWKRGSGPNHRFVIGVDPGSHMAGTLGGINVESGSGHGPMVGGKALGAYSGFQYQFYLPAADLPQLSKGGTILADNTLANLHKKETVLTAPLSEALDDAIASGFGNTYNINMQFMGPVNNEIDFEKCVRRVIDKIDAKNGRKKVVP